jgi:hypothetical protein
MKLRNLQAVAPADFPQPAAPRADGIATGQLHYKYIPRTGEWDKADVAYATLTPAEGSNSRVTGMWRGEGTVQFHHARWEDMPTQHMIVNAFHQLEIREYRGATITQAVGAKDLSDQRRLE